MGGAIEYSSVADECGRPSMRSHAPRLTLLDLLQFFHNKRASWNTKREKGEDRNESYFSTVNQGDSIFTMRN
jgi:hypothetical protein